MDKAIIVKRKKPQTVVVSDVDSGRQTRISLQHNHTLLDILPVITGAGLPVDRIILYGSCARGTMKCGSDVDLLCAMKRLPCEEETDAARKIRSKGMALEPEADVQFYLSETIEQSSHVFFQEVRKDGLTIWRSG